MRKALVAVFAFVLLIGGWASGAGAQGQEPAAAMDSLDGSPLDSLPPHITQLKLPAGLENAARPSWSPDGKKIVVLDALIGNAWEYDLKRGTAKNLSTKLHPAGVLRANYLPNGDLVLCAPPDRDPTNPASDRVRGQPYLMPRPLGSKQLVQLGAPCWEGPAVTRTPGSTKIGWTESNLDFTSDEALARTLPIATSQLFVGRIDYSKSGPRLVDKKLVVDGKNIPSVPLETQDFRDKSGRKDGELLFTAYTYRNGEVMGVDLSTGEIVDYSRSAASEEAEGVDPQGRFELVEGPAPEVGNARSDLVDIWRLSLDGNAGWERLTDLRAYKGYGAGNPVVAPDRTQFIFNVDKDGAEPGASFGLLLFDLKAWRADGGGNATPEPARLPPYARATGT